MSPATNCYCSSLRILGSVCYIPLQQKELNSFYSSGLEGSVFPPPRYGDWFALNYMVKTWTAAYLEALIIQVSVSAYSVLLINPHPSSPQKTNKGKGE